MGDCLKQKTVPLFACALHASKPDGANPRRSSVATKP